MSCCCIVTLEHPVELSQKLHVSKRQLYNLVDEFRAMGASIKYSREIKHIIIQMTLIKKVNSASP